MHHPHAMSCAGPVSMRVRMDAYPVYQLAVASGKVSITFKVLKVAGSPQKCASGSQVPTSQK